MRIDEKTIEKSLISSTLSLIHAYSITKKVNINKAKILVSEFIENKITNNLLSDIKENKNDDILNIIQKYIDEYRSKKDKSYTALLKIEERIKRRN